MTEQRLAARPFVLAIGVSVALVLSAPFVGFLRSEIRRAFPGQSVNVVGILLLAGVGAAFAAAIWRIRERRMSRYAGIALAVVIAAAYSAYRAGPNPESNAVERFHFLQYGLITFLFYRAWRPLGDSAMFLLPVCAGLLVGTAEEWFQWFIPNRVGELADVFLNLIAICTGLLFSVSVEPPPVWRGLPAASRARVGRLAAATAIALGAFVHAVHLGHVVIDEEAGHFTSRYSRAQLLALQEDRAARWRVSPPSTTLIRLSREDQYLTEGIQHVRERNRCWDAGRFAAAWRENRILEKYFEPVLDTPTHEGAGHRWPPAQRADAETRSVADGTTPYVSGAYPARILTWHPAALWAAVLAIAGGTLLLTQRRARPGTTADSLRVTGRTAD